MWLILSQINHSESWNQSNLDNYIGAYEANSTSWVAKVDPDGNHTLVNAKVSQGYKSVTVSGTYLNSNKDSKSYTVVIEEDKWNTAFDYSGVDSNNTVVTFTHASYSSEFAKIIADNKTKAAASERNNYYVTVVDAFQVSWWDTWGPTIIMIGVVTVLGIIFFVRLNGSVNGANRQAMDFNKSPARREDASKVRFDDVAGCDEEKAEMVELVEYLKDPKKYSKFGARLPKGVLLIGPPGTGKTLLAKAVAGEAKVPFYSISGSDFVEMFVGVGAGRVRDLFKRAKQTAPCLIFIDEIDAVGRQRGAGLGGGNDEREQTLNQLLVEMDGFEANTGILVIAATNRDDVLDPALLRAGRFDRTITVNLPDRAGREAIFKVHARNKKIDPSLDWSALAQRTVGFSGADIENILNEAAILAVRENKTQVDLADIDEAIDRRIAGPAKSGKGMCFVTEPKLAWIFLIIIPLCLFFLFLLAIKVHPTFVKVFETYDDLNQVVQEDVDGIRVVKAFDREELEKKKFHDITLYAKPGQKVAFVGPTGAGKTTITNLINRFYDIEDGKIRYDDININKIKKTDLRRSLGVVLQDVKLFTGTVKENIRYGKLDATDEEVVAAAKLANADSFIRNLPQGYDTVLEAGGASLSQGQRQLLSIARCAVADPPVMAS